MVEHKVEHNVAHHEEDNKEEHHAAHHEEKHEHEKTSDHKKVNVWMIVSAVLAACLVIAVAFMLMPKGGAGITGQQVSEKLANYINENVPGTAFNITSVEDTGGIYKIGLIVGGNKFESYMSKDGSLLFPSGIPLAEAKVNASKDEVTPAEAPKEVVKSDKPVVELFVMSHCPYGTQIEKGIVPVVEALGKKIDFSIKFCDYAMHGEKELREELNQYCIQKEFNSDYIDYLKCFLEDGNTSRCVEKAGIDESELADCINATDAKYKVMAGFNDKNTWNNGLPSFGIYQNEVDKYGVGGSPTFILNGLELGGTPCGSDKDCHIGEACVNTRTGKACSLQRDAESLKKAVCSAFTEAPSECDKNLSSASPSPGFGYDAGAAGTAAGGCGA